MEETMEQSPWPKAGLFSAIAVCTLIGGGLVTYLGLKPVPVDTPSAYDTYKSADNTYACEYPQGWGSTAADSHGVASSAKFSKGAARIYVESDLAGSLVGDVSRSGSAAIPDLPPGMEVSPGLSNAVATLKKPAVEKIHEAKKEHAGEEMHLENYQEQTAKPFNTRVGEGRFSEFTGDAGGLTGKMHGYRATIVGTERAYYVWCKAAEADWPKLDKAFLRVIGSLKPAQ